MRMMWGNCYGDDDDNDGETLIVTVLIDDGE